MSTAVPVRNFTMTVEERVRALVQGPPAFMRRKRHIEDLEAAIVHGLVLLDRGEVPLPETFRFHLERQLAKLNELITVHNRYYPSEANLPMDPVRGCLIENGAPWHPMACVTMGELHQRARASAPGG